MILNRRNLTINDVAGADKVIYLGSRPRFTYANGIKTDEYEGETITVVAYANNFQTFAVKLAKDAPELNFEQDEVDRRNAALNPILLSFEGFEAKIYRARETGEDKLTAKANKAIVVSQTDKKTGTQGGFPGTK